MREGAGDAVRPGLGAAYPQQLCPELRRGHAVEAREPVLLDLLLGVRAAGILNLTLCCFACRHGAPTGFDHDNDTHVFFASESHAGYSAARRRHVPNFGPVI